MGKVMGNMRMDDLLSDSGRKYFLFDAKTMNGVTYEDCEYIAQARGWLLSSYVEEKGFAERSGFTTRLYCVPNEIEHCLDAHSEDAAFRCRVKKSKKGEAFFIEDGGYYRLNIEFINTLRE